MYRKVVKVLIAIVLFCWTTESIAQNPVKVTVESVKDARLQSLLSVNASRLLSEINSAFSEKRNLKIDRNIITPSAASSLLAIWEMSIFSCEKNDIIEQAINMKRGFEIRNIPINIKEAPKDENHEECVIVFNSEGQIENFYISIGTNRVNEILQESNSVTDFRRRQIILDFVENFRTAYNRRDLDFINKVFSEDALIITGSVIQSKPQSTDMLTANLSTDQVRYTRLSKTQYVNGLKRVFANNQYINIKFDSIEVVKHKKYPEIYGITLKQHWNTTRYSDVGYVFLLIDFQDEENPIIHVRTWQPEKYANGKRLERDEVFGLGTFGDYNRK